MGAGGFAVAVVTTRSGFATVTIAVAVAMQLLPSLLSAMMFRSSAQASRK
jgi:hypothetical protein